jgi:LDH2 family malate/lactate/ureidoglycolate dehydrogenase
VFYPGEIEHRTALERRRNGIAIEPRTWNRFVDIAAEYGIAERLDLKKVD